jgi:hypothetical protein
VIRITTAAPCYHRREVASLLTWSQDRQEADMAGTDGGFLALLLAMGVLLYVSWMRTEWRQ